LRARKHVRRETRQTVGERFLVPQVPGGVEAEDIEGDRFVAGAQAADAGGRATDRRSVVDRPVAPYPLDGRVARRGHALAEKDLGDHVAAAVVVLGRVIARRENVMALFQLVDDRAEQAVADAAGVPLPAAGRSSALSGQDA
jgi:hypothetical protein